MGWTESDFDYEENTLNTGMQTTGTELPANNDDIVNGTTRRQQLYDRLMLDGVYDLIQSDQRDGLSRDRFDWDNNNDKTNTIKYIKRMCNLIKPTE